jgi:hypothetical protein
LDATLSKSMYTTAVSFRAAAAIVCVCARLFKGGCEGRSVCVNVY